MKINEKDLIFARDFIPKLQSDIAERCKEIMKWRNENGIEILKERYVWDYPITEVDIDGDSVYITVHETWAYGGQEDYCYAFTFDELISDSWHEDFLKDVGDKRIEIARAEEEKKRARVAKEAIYQRRLYEELKKIFEDSRKE